MEFGEFISAHDGDDLSRLALARERYAAEVEDFDLALTTLEVRRKLRTKVPQWHAVAGLRYPLRISGEQCSSSETAFYKASVAARAGSRIADLTGGLGVDTWAFSKVARGVLYNEMNPELAAAAEHNFSALGVKNVIFRNFELSVIPGVSSVIPGEASVSHTNLPQILDGFTPDVIFLDPARRADDGRKVFRLEDCTPNVLELLPDLLKAAPHVLLKLSPMADITLAVKQLGSVREVHVVASDGECKELLMLLERGYEGEFETIIYENGSIIPAAADGGVLKPAATLGGRYLFEPGKALLKAGAFELPCRFGLEKIGRHTHLYTGAVPEELKPFGKCFEILEVLPLNNKTIKDLGKRYPQASVTARNIPLTSDQLRKKLGVKDGGTVHIFGLRSDAENSNLLLVCSV